jgi:hypothetical protein
LEGLEIGSWSFGFPELIKGIGGIYGLVGERLDPVCREL